MIDVQFLWDVFLQLLPGLPTTLGLAIIACALGTILATGLTLLSVSGLPLLPRLVSLFVFVLRGTPLLLLIFLIYYGLGQFRPQLKQLGLWGFFREPYFCALLALTLSTAAYGSEILRGGLKAVAKGQIEAARASGMSGALLYRRIILPLAFRQALPAFGNEIILTVKATSLASTITIMDITGIAARLISESFRALEIFIVAGAIYLFINFVITRLVAATEYWLSPHLRDLPVSTQLEITYDTL